MIYKVIFILTIFISPCLYGESTSSPKSYTIGVVPQFDSRTILNIWAPILSHLNQKTKTNYELSIPSSIGEFEKKFNKGEYDYCYMNPYHLIVANKAQGYLPILKDHGRKLYGVIVVKKNSNIKSINDLEGKKVAFPSPNALGAALIPRTEFSRKFNIDVQELYVKSHTSVYMNVFLGTADAGGGVKKSFDKCQPNIKSQLKIIYETTKVTPHPIAAHPRIPQKEVSTFVNCLIEMTQNEDTLNQLRKVPFKKLGTASIQDYTDLKNLGLEDFYKK